MYIYCLWCPIAHRIRYIGKTKNPKSRLYMHTWFAKNGTKHHTGRWLRKLLALGLEPRFRILVHIKPKQRWQDIERAIIRAALAKGWPLTNQSAGGDGVEYLSPEDSERAKKARVKGVTPEVRARKSASMKLRWADPSYKERLVSILRAASASPERRAILQIAANSRTAEGEQRRLAAVKKHWSDPANRVRNAEATKQRMTDPAFVEKWMQSLRKK